MHFPGRLVGRALAAVTLTLATAPPLVTASTPVDQASGIPVAEPASNDWMTYGGNYYNQRYSSLDANSGNVLWSVQDDDPRAGYSQTMAPLFYNGMVIVGISGAEYEIRGHVTAYDAASGNQMWRFYTIPAPGEFGSDTWPQGSEM